MFHHVGILWMTVTKYKISFAVDEQYVERCTVGPCSNDKVLRNLHGPLFEELFATSREYRYDLMCGLYANKKLK